MSLFIAMVIMVPYYWYGAVFARKMAVKNYRTEQYRPEAIWTGILVFMFWPVVWMWVTAGKWFLGPVDKERAREAEIQAQIRYWGEEGGRHPYGSKESDMCVQIIRNLRDQL